VFVVVNGALFILQGRKGEHRSRFEIPRVLPALGALVCFVLIVVRVATGDVAAPALAGGLLLGAMAVYAVMQRRT
jgi:APA family basic amino acid/polyamine antiporter